jgi:hypothetical protein
MRRQDILSQARHWDSVTRRVVLARVNEVPPVRFFDAREERTLRAFLDVVLAQDEQSRIPVLEMVDDKLYSGRLDGYRHHDMPPDPQVWQQVAARLDDEAVKEGGDGGFAAAPGAARQEIVARFAAGKLEWPGLDCTKAWGVVMRGALSAFYAHPRAWDEIGFGGPAYPRGYARLGAGQREPWEGE